MRNKTFWISLMLLIHTTLSSQITIDQGDMPQLGDTIRVSTGINLDIGLVELSGENYFWDFSAISPISQTLDTIINPLAIPIGFWFLNAANQAKRLQQDMNLGAIALTNTFGFFQNTTQAYTDAGFTASLGIIPIPFKYETPDVLYQFPMYYGLVDSSHAYLAFGLDNLGYIMIDKKRTNIVDGWGTLATPYGTFETLRVRSEVDEYDSIYIDSLNIGIPVHRQYTEYKWLGKNHKLPLLTVTKNFNVGGLIVQYIDSMRRDLIGVGEQKPMPIHNLSLSPNPTIDHINISFDLLQDAMVSFEIYTLEATLIYSSTAKGKSKGFIRMNTSATSLGLNRGMYVFVLYIDKQYVSRKLLIE